ncbi:PEROXIDASE_4 domain-containing protein, partial [Haematococcus lacustris]
MKPHRVRMAHALILRYGLYRHLEVYKPVKASEEAMATFHTDDYIEFLKRVTPDNQEQHAQQLRQYTLANDCPIFDRMFEYCQVRLGRQDASGPDPEGRLPGEQLTSQQLKDVFSAKGFSSREFLALCGAHTLGSKGFGDPTTFDNVYFKELLRKPWLDTKDSMAAMIGLPSDHVLPDDPELLPMIQARAIHCTPFPAAPEAGA